MGYESRSRFEASSNESGERLDVLVSEKSGLSRARVQKLISDGLVSVNGQTAIKSKPVAAGDFVEITIPALVPSGVRPERIELDIKYEDGDIIVLSKPAGLVVHPAAGHRSGTLVNALLSHTKGLSGIGGEDRPGIVHRLDKDTSGLMLVAKTDAAHSGLSDQLRNRTIGKTYTALVRGGLKTDSGAIDEPIGRHPKDRKKMAVEPKRGREAKTTWRVIDRYKGYTLVEVSLMTGRTHQIRVHLSHIGHPLAGDPVYGRGDKADSALGLDRQFLHASGLRFIHPVTGEKMSFSDELPKDLKDALERLVLK